MPQNILRAVSDDDLAGIPPVEATGNYPRAPESDAPEQDTSTPNINGDLDEQLQDDSLVGHVRNKYEYFRWHRARHDLHRRNLDALRAYNGEYTPTKLASIKEFGGSDVYSRLTATKCRGATALLKDVYLGADRPWGLDATPNPTVPDEVSQDISQLVQSEAINSAQLGQPVDEAAIRGRAEQLHAGAQLAAKRQAAEDVKKGEQYVDDLLVEGGFYSAFGEFLIDLPIFTFACIKGPVIRNSLEVKWVNGRLTTQTVPKMFWYRVSPFDLYLDPGVSKIEDGAVIERIRLTRADLSSLIGLKGYNEDAIREVLTEYDRGLQDWLDDTETERADEENRENPYLNRSELIDSLEYHGAVKGEWLLDYGFGTDQITDPDLDYHVVCWVIGRHVIKVMINPNSRMRHPYYITSFEKVPGSMYGNALPEVIADAQDVANAALRSLVNNMSMASGPQVSVNEDRLSPTTNADSMYPWKRWRFVSDPMGDTTPPISFFQPNSNSQELLVIYRTMMEMADEVSAIPRYMTGSDKMGGAAGTASGLSMLMNNASKVLQSVAGNIDHDVFRPLLEGLYDMVMLIDGGTTLRGDESVHVRGVAVALQRETDRMRQLEFLNMTANPIDMDIMGKTGRAELLRSLSKELGMPYNEVVPSRDALEAKIKSEQEMMAVQQEAMAQEEAAAQAQGAQAPNPAGSARLSQPTDNSQRTRTPRAINRQSQTGNQPT